MPGHGSWHRGMPEITPLCGGLFDPTSNATYVFLTRFLREMGTIFPDQYLALGATHTVFWTIFFGPAKDRLPRQAWDGRKKATRKGGVALSAGGDEVGYSCAGNVPAIKRWLAAHNLTAPELLPYFWQRVTADVLPKLNRTLHVWVRSCLLFWYRFLRGSSQ
jgi:hypothetical protein